MISTLVAYLARKTYVLTKEICTIYTNKARALKEGGESSISSIFLFSHIL